MREIIDRYNVNHILTVKDEANEEQVEQMVADAVLAYTNWMFGAAMPCFIQVDKAELVKARDRYESEYNRLVRSIGRYVSQPTSHVKDYVIAIYEEKYLL